MKQYFLITHADKTLQVREEIFFEEREKLPQWTSCSGGFDTIEALKEHNEIPDYKCSKCGGEVTLHYNNKAELEAHKMCFSCNHFRGQYEAMKTNPNKHVIDGVIYTIYPDAPNSLFKGYGGREFKIKPIIGDGKIIITHNLWCQGEVPQAWKANLQNTAEFVKE